MITNPPIPVHTVWEWKQRVQIDPWVPIARCSDPSMWYAREIGQTYLIEKVTVDGLWSREPAGYINIIKFADADF